MNLPRALAVRPECVAERDAAVVGTVVRALRVARDRARRLVEPVVRDETSGTVARDAKGSHDGAYQGGVALGGALWPNR